MVSDKDTKLKEIEKERIKAQQKQERKMLKMQYEEDKRRLKEEAELRKIGVEREDDNSSELVKSQSLDTSLQKSDPNMSTPTQTTAEDLPWYKNPSWIRAIVAIASLIVTIIALIFTFIISN